MREMLDKFMDQESLHTFEGRRGLVNFAKVCRAIGYADPQHMGQLEQGACVGDTMVFLEDNPGAFEALLAWVGKQRNAEWYHNVGAQLTEDFDEDDEDA